MKLSSISHSLKRISFSLLRENFAPAERKRRLIITPTVRHETKYDKEESCGKNKTRKVFDVSPFSKISATSGIEVKHSISECHQVKVIASPSALEAMSVNVFNGELILGTSVDFSEESPILVVCSSKKLCSISTSDTVIFQSLDPVDEDLLAVKASGSSVVVLKGLARTMSIEAIGASRVCAKRLISRETKATASCKALITLNTTTKLVALASGSSTIIEKGSPFVASRNSTGVSSIETINERT
jgi:hypothetical protein